MVYNAVVDLNPMKAVAPPPQPQIPVKPSFQNMPLHLQTKVLAHLHWKEVLRVRRVRHPTKLFTLLDCLSSSIDM
jgi:hypothetical protein